MKKLNYFSAIQFLSKYIGRHKRNFIMFYCGWFFDTMLRIIMPILFGIMIDEIVYHQNIDSFLRISLVFVIMSVFSCLLYFLIYAQHQYLMSMYCFDIQRDIFRHYTKCSAEYLVEAKSGDIVTMIQFYARECMHFVIRNIIHIINAILEIGLLVVYIFIISPWIGVLVLVAVPMAVLVNARFGKKIRDYSNEQREMYGTYVSFIYEILTAVRDIRLLGAKRKVNHEIVGHQRKMIDVNIKSGIASITAQNIIDGTNLVIQLVIFTMTAYLVINGDMTIGLLTVVLAYFASLKWRFTQVSESYLDAQNRVGFIQRIYDFMQAPTEDGWKGKNELVVTDGEIKFEGVSFSYCQNGNSPHGEYPSSPSVLQNFNLHIKAGEKFSLCGKSGCGKTTLAYMLIGFYQAQAGEIYIDGQKLPECSLRSIRKNIGMISQDVLLFAGSIKENLLLGKPRANEQELWSALERAGIADFIKTLPEGMDTPIGVGGTGLSGGQKQRISIARIYLKDPKIIIFDEATSSLDDETEQMIHDAWDQVLKGRTSIVVAHRQSAVMLCERTAIMVDGVIAEIGDPLTMEKESDLFRELFVVKEGLDVEN